MNAPVIIGDATLYHGDCLDLLRTAPTRRIASVDAMITDPVWPTCPDGLLPGADDERAGLLGAATMHATRGLGVRTVVVILGFDCDPRFLGALPEELPYIRSQQLPYAMPGYRGRLLGGDEVAYVFGEIPKGHGVIPGRAPVETKAGRSKVDGQNHPCPRTEIHMRSLVGWWSEPGATVLDPFMGSGTTGVACAQVGRKFIGIEIERKYFDIACERIDNAYRQQRLFA